MFDALGYSYIHNSTMQIVEIEIIFIYKKQRRAKIVVSFAFHLGQWANDDAIHKRTHIQ